MSGKYILIFDPTPRENNPGVLEKYVEEDIKKLFNNDHIVHPAVIVRCPKTNESQANDALKEAIRKFTMDSPQGWQIKKVKI